MNNINKRLIREAMIPLLKNRQPMVATESARILCALDGLWVTEGLTAQAAEGKVSIELKMARDAILQKLAKQTEQKRIQNRRAYLKKRLRTLQEQQTVNSTAITTEEHEIN